MINWINDEPVKVQTSQLFESVILTLDHVIKGTKRVELLDEHGFVYHTSVDHLTFLMPEDIQAIFTEGEQVSKYFKLKEGDLI